MPASLVSRLAQPETTIVHSAGELATCDLLPAYVKTPVGTATTGVRHVQNRAEATALATTWDAAGVFRRGPALVQAPCDGRLVMIQTIFSDGELVASHVNVRLREGASGGASHKRSVDLPAVREDLGRLGADLCWRGALSADAILTDRGPVYIDINPRLVEPANVWRSGVDLVRALLIDVARDRPQTPQAPGREGVTTHQLLLAVLGAAQHRHTRRAVAWELLDAALHRDTYRASVEELTPLRRDPRTILPIAAASTATLIHPNTWRWFSTVRSPTTPSRPTPGKPFATATSDLTRVPQSPGRGGLARSGRDWKAV